MVTSSWQWTPCNRMRVAGYVCRFTFVCAADLSDRYLVWVLGRILVFNHYSTSAHHKRRVSYIFLGGVLEDILNSSTVIWWVLLAPHGLSVCALRTNVCLHAHNLTGHSSLSSCPTIMWHALVFCPCNNPTTTTTTPQPLATTTTIITAAEEGCARDASRATPTHVTRPVDLHTHDSLAATSTVRLGWRGRWWV